MNANIARKKFARALAQGDQLQASIAFQELSESIRGSEEWNFHDVPFHADEFSRRHKLDDLFSKEYLFVSGTPRTGTTALGRLLNLHPNISLFTELYSGLLGYHPAMFTPQFIRHARPRGAFSAFDAVENQNALCSFDGAKVVGDKRPNFILSIATTSQWFSGQALCIVHVVRDPYDVACSYLERVHKGTWSESRDHKAAVEEMNLNTSRALDFLEGNQNPNHQLLVVDYEIFWSDPNVAAVLFNAIGRCVVPEVGQGLEFFYKMALNVRAKARELPFEARAYIDANFDFTSYDRLKGFALGRRP